MNPISGETFALFLMDSHSGRARLRHSTPRWVWFDAEPYRDRRCNYYASTPYPNWQFTRHPDSQAATR
ncbi:MAG TPA: hypothetical protein VGP62_10825, partial [Bryobacteraceae bacterium]|nr:hypothetical protein [Bryobacteraceae bacterium]